MVPTELCLHRFEATDDVAEALGGHIKIAQGSVHGGVALFGVCHEEVHGVFDARAQPDDVENDFYRGAVHRTGVEHAGLF